MAPVASRSVAVLVLALLVTAACATKSVKVAGDSMAPTLKDGDVRFVDTGAYNSSPPKRGDIVTYHQVYENIGRVIGLPGETVGIANGQVSINGAVLAEAYLAPGTQTTAPQDTYAVPAGSYFMLKDNRGHAADSRTMGFVPRSAIEGKLS